MNAAAKAALCRGTQLKHLMFGPLAPCPPGYGSVTRVAAWPAEFIALERGGVPAALLQAALTEARRTGVAPFDALVALGRLSDDHLTRSLAAGLGIDFLASADGDAPAIDADAFALAMTIGLLELTDAAGRPRLVFAARGVAPNELARSLLDRPADRPIELATPRVFADLAVRCAGNALAERASQGPALTSPELTVAGGMPKIAWPMRIGLVTAIAFLAFGVFNFDAIAGVAATSAGLLFGVMNIFKLWIACTPLIEQGRSPRVPDHDLPVYTVLVGLVHEGETVVSGLLDALERLDYPAAKLDIKILTEAGDDETLDALRARPPRAGIEVLVLPQGGPKTKPRALNAGLLAARGSFVTVFDAEDRPDPDQLRLAVATFRRSAANVACLQARLAIDNAADGWLPSHFAIEYAALFDVGIPALATLGMPIPLGGTSNHFRTAVLRSVGGWDAGNVTEDADLGLRLARFGWKTKSLPSTTWEEAPAQPEIWLKQRTRWMKGFMVTAIVHGRRPRSLAQNLDPLSLMASVSLVGGVALTALAYPVMAAIVVYQTFSGALLAPAESLAGATMTGFHIANLIVGFSSGLACAWMGVDRRCPQQMARHLLTIPFYWMLVGVAAWRALLQIVFSDTTRWEKTTHGLSQNRATPPQM